MAINIKATEAEIKETQKLKEEEELKVQIEVYEGQSYESREKYQEVKQKRSTARRKLPEDVPTDTSYKEQDLQAQYIQANIVSPNQEKQVKEYRAEIKKQQTASKKVQVLDKELPQLYASAVQEVESVKTGIAQAKQKVSDKYDTVIQTKTTALETEKARRAKQIADVEATYQETLSNNPYTDENAKIQKAKHMSRHFNVTRFSYEWGKASTNYIKSASQSKQDAMSDIRLEHYTADGFPFVNVGTVTRDAGQLLGDIAMGRGMNYRNISAQGRHQVELIMAKRNLLSGNITEAQYFQQTGQSNVKKQAYDKQQSDMRSKQAQAKVAGYLKADSAHWASVASNPYTSNPNATTPNFTVGSGTKDDPFRTDYNKGKTAIGETTTPPKDMLAHYIQDYQKQSKTYNKAKTGLENTNYSQADLQQINKQRENELTNVRQTQYVAELRAGNIGYADALMNPQTTQSYTGTSTVNLKTFLKERGYDLTKPEAIPNSVLTTPVKYDKARETASDSVKFNTPMGDLRTKEPYYAGFSVSDGKMAWNYKYPLASKEVIQQRMEAKQRIAKFDPLTPAVQRKEGTKTGVKFTNLPAPQIGTLDSGGVFTKKDFNPYSASAPTEVAMMKATGQQYVVGSRGFSPFPMMAGGTFDARTPVTTDTLAEAQYKAKTQQTRVFSGFDNSALEGWNYASAVETGEVINPSKTETWVDDARFRLSQVYRPTYNIGAMAYNLSQPQDKQLPIKSTAEDVLIGGTIEDVKEGNILKGTGVTGLGKYIEEDYFRAGFELPSAVFTAMAGGKAISYGVKGVSYGVSTTAKLGNKIIQGNAPTIVKVPTMAMMGTGQAIQRTGAKVSAIPSRIGSSVYAYGTIPTGTKYGMPSFTIPQQVVRQGIVKPYDTATMFQGSRVGFGAKANFIMTPSGRMFVRQSTDIAGEIGAKPQFLNKQVAMFENENVVGFATRGKMKTTKYDMPKETPFKSDVFEPTKKTELVLKNQPKEKKPFPELYDSKATTSGKPFPDDLVKVEDIGKRNIPKLQTPTVLDRIKSTALYRTKVSAKQYKTNIDEVTFYSDTTGDLVKGVKRPKAELQGEGVNYRGFEKPEITGTRTRLQDYKTSTSQSTIKGQLKYSEVAGGKIKFKGSPVRQVDTIVTGAKLTGKKNLKLIDDMVEEGQIEEVGKKTVMKGTDYFGGGKKAGQLKQSLESRNPTTYEAQSGKIKPKDETILYGVSKGKIPVDKKAFAQTMKESNLLREMADKAPLNKKPKVPKGVDEPPTEKYHAFIGESKSTGKTFQGTRVELGSGIGTTGVGSSFTKTNVDLGKGGGISNIKDVKGMSSKPDVVGVTTNRINVKKFEEPKIQKGDKIVDGKEGSTVQRTKLDTFQETKIKLGQSAVAKPAQVQVPKVKASVKPPKVSPKVKQIVTPTVSQKTGTGLVQETAQLTKQQTKQQTKQKPKIKQAQRLRAVQSQSAITAVVAKTAQVQAVAQMKLPTIQKTTKRKGAGTLFYDTPNPQIEKRKRKRGKKAGFIGNVRLDNVVGMYKRKEITYGQKKVTKLERQDMRLTAGTKNRIALPSSGLLKTKKKKKSMFGKKTKDEFAGFKENKTKKQTKRRKKSKTTKVRLL
tara:strand:+ start:8428 stop:13251 length:4824 start_codon:yes stop_codon:yes gene_type:complete